MSFNFGSLATTQATSNAQARLKPWGIYPVTFAGATKVSFQGKKDPSQTYDVLRVRFDGEDGYYEESIFYPKPGDEVRPKYTNREGHEYEAASSFERTMTFIAQVAEVLNPEGFKKMQEQSSKFRSFDDVVKAFIVVTDKAKGKKTNLKLVGKTQQDGNVVPALPKFVAVAKDGNKFTSDNFIGDKLFFSAYEEGRKADYLKAKPTAIKETKDSVEYVAPAEQPADDGDDIDFEKLL